MGDPKEDLCLWRGVDEVRGPPEGNWLVGEVQCWHHLRQVLALSKDDMAQSETRIAIFEATLSSPCKDPLPLAALATSRIQSFLGVLSLRVLRARSLSLKHFLRCGCCMSYPSDQLPPIGLVLESARTSVFVLALLVEEVGGQVLEECLAWCWIKVQTPRQPSAVHVATSALALPFEQDVFWMRRSASRASCA